jgi:hypothetical protein
MSSDGALGRCSYQSADTSSQGQRLDIHLPLTTSNPALKPIAPVESCTSASTKVPEQQASAFEPTVKLVDVRTRRRIHNPRGRRAVRVVAKVENVRVDRLLNSDQVWRDTARPGEQRRLASCRTRSVS